jgi:signal peptidase II
MSTPWKVRALFAACVSSLVGCDHASKRTAEAVLRDRAPIPIVRNVVDLTYCENHDIAFNALSRLALHASPWTLAAFAFVVTAAVLLAWMRWRSATWPQHAGLALVCAGAIGNGLDRLMRGSVVDFIHVRFWPVFNIADVLIVGGVVLLVLRRKAGPGGVPERASGGADFG